MPKAPSFDVAGEVWAGAFGALWRGSGAVCMGSCKVLQFVLTKYRKFPNCRKYTIFMEKQKMTIAELIALAKKQSGMSLGAMAQELNIRQARISEWKKGQFKPDAGELAYFAEKAGLNVAETVMEIERELDPRFAPIWERALGNLRAAMAAYPTQMTTTTHSMIEAARGVVKSLLYRTSQQGA